MAIDPKYVNMSVEIDDIALALYMLAMETVREESKGKDAGPPIELKSFQLAKIIEQIDIKVHDLHTKIRYWNGTLPQEQTEYILRELQEDEITQPSVAELSQEISDLAYPIALISDEVAWEEKRRGHSGAIFRTLNEAALAIALIVDADKEKSKQEHPKWLERWEKHGKGRKYELRSITTDGMNGHDLADHLEKLALSIRTVAHILARKQDILSHSGDFYRELANNASKWCTKASELCQQFSDLYGEKFVADDSDDTTIEKRKEFVELTERELELAGLLSDYGIELSAIAMSIGETEKKHLRADRVFDLLKQVLMCIAGRASDVQSRMIYDTQKKRKELGMDEKPIKKAWP
ncbi:hypothetical protein BDV95DRAFT_651950 [Massariosphaeria phaeospora]|uniref:Uncharacterized protein n=1 Tax=Massariosphaeria phaeospora TaxID=100035 RepID=A0A7C8HZ54_9PLEO|nr:hypothetical protein BDV95DRAFT_651950 [Massariosphaeria phaeospora]